MGQSLKPETESSRCGVPERAHFSVDLKGALPAVSEGLSPGHVRKGHGDAVEVGVVDSATHEEVS